MRLILPKTINPGTNETATSVKNTYEKMLSGWQQAVDDCEEDGKYNAGAIAGAGINFITAIIQLSGGNSLQIATFLRQTADMYDPPSKK